MQERVIAFVGRHGETDANATGCFRGWSAVDLNQEGYGQARAMRDFLKDKPIKLILSSPLMRARATAEIVAEPHRLPVMQTGELLPWHIGMFAGEPKDEAQDALRLFVRNPYVQVPKGESLEEFESRQFAFWRANLDPEVLTLFLCHTSNVTALVNFSEGAEEAEPEFGDSVEPGGVGAVYWDGKSYRVEPIFGQKEVAQFGGS